MIPLKKIKAELKDLMEYKDEIALIYIYGSAVKKKKYADIDVLVVYDDVDKGKNEFRVGMEVEKLKRKKGSKLHLQSLKMLSAWWRAVISGEPWILTSIQNRIVLYDKYGIVDKVSGMLGKEEVFLREEKAESMLEYSDKLDMENRSLLLESVSDLVGVATDTSRVLLILKTNRIVIDKKKIARELAKLKFGESVEHYRTLLDLESKIGRGVLTEFSGENLDFYLEKVKALILKAEKEMRKIK